MEVLSARVRELYGMFSLRPPVMIEDMVDVRLDVDGAHTVEELIEFLEGKITKQSLEDKQPSKDDS